MLFRRIVQLKQVDEKHETSGRHYAESGHSYCILRVKYEIKLRRINEDEMPPLAIHYIVNEYATVRLVIQQVYQPEAPSNSTIRKNVTNNVTSVIYFRLRLTKKKIIKKWQITIYLFVTLLYIFSEPPVKISTFSPARCKKFHED